MINSVFPVRKPTRLPKFDYNTPGCYFLTICTEDKKKLLCSIVGGGLPDAPRTEKRPGRKIPPRLFLCLFCLFPRSFGACHYGAYAAAVFTLLTHKVKTLHRCHMGRILLPGASIQNNLFPLNHDVITLCTVAFPAKCLKILFQCTTAF